MAKVKQAVKAKATTKKKKKIKVTTPKVLVKIKSTYNNTLVSVTDYSGNVISSSSCGKVGFAGSKKSTAYAATRAGEDAALKAIQAGAREAEIIIKGIGVGRQAAVKGIRASGLRITMLADHTPVPHGGVKPRKQPKK